MIAETKEKNLESFLESRFDSLPIYYVLVTGIQFYALQQLDFDYADKRIMDLGCNDGLFFQKLLGNLASGGYKVGLDIDPIVVRGAAGKKIFDETIVADIRRMPYADNSFDIIISNSTLEHIEDIGKVVSEIRRVLKPGGKIIFTVPAEKFISFVFPFLNLFSEGIRRKILRSRFFEIINILPYFEWENMFSRDNGFKIKEFRKYMSGYSMRVASFLSLEVVLWSVTEKVFGRPLKLAKIKKVREFIKSAIKNGLCGEGEFLLIAEKAA